MKLQTQTLRYNRMHWLEVTGLAKHWQDSRVDAEIVDPQTYHLTTRNVTALTLDRYYFLNGATIKIDDQVIQIPRYQSIADFETVF